MIDAELPLGKPLFLRAVIQNAADLVVRLPPGVQACSAAFSHSRCMGFLNFIRNGQQYLADVADAADATPGNRVCVSGPAVLVSVVAYSEPARPARPQPRAKADSLTRAALIPMHVAANSSSRIATQARPNRERSKLRSNRITTSSRPSAK